MGFLLPIYAKRLGAGALEVGVLFAAFSIVSLLRPLVGMALDRYGRRPFLVAGLACYTLAMGLFAAAGQMEILCVARFVQGLGSVLVWISAYTIATDVSEAGGRGRAVGRVDEASARGSLLGAFIGFTLLVWSDLGTGWSILFAGYALLASLAVFNAWRNIHETQPVKEEPMTGEVLDSGIALLRSPLARLMLIVFFTRASRALISPLLMVFVQDRFSTEVGVLALAYVPAAVIHSLLPSRMGWLSDRWGRTRPMVVGLVVSGMVSILLTRIPSLGWLVLLWVLEALGLVIAAPAEEALVADLTGGRLRGTGYGLYSFSSSLGATFGPLLGGWLYEVAGHTVPFTLNGVMLLVAAALVPVLLGTGLGDE